MENYQPTQNYSTEKYSSFRTARKGIATLLCFSSIGLSALVGCGKGGDTPAGPQSPADPTATYTPAPPTATPTKTATPVSTSVMPQISPTPPGL